MEKLNVRVVREAFQVTQLIHENGIHTDQSEFKTISIHRLPQSLPQNK